MLLYKFSGKLALAPVLLLALFASCMHKKYETPITKNTQQPDKVLFDQAIHDIEHGRYEVARLSLQTLMNTYDSSEYLAKAKLAIADSWYREGGANGLAQAEAEYKDFILFYPNMPESAEAQNRVCEIHYKQMDKSDRDVTQTLLAEQECRLLLQQFPNSKFVAQAAQRLRNIQESLAQHEFDVGTFYFSRDMNPAAANRLNALADQYPLYSRADEALYEAGVSYSKMGPRFRKDAGAMFTRIVREYPLSARAADAKRRLQDMELPIPEIDRAAYQREKLEQANYHRPGLLARSTGWMRGSPDLSHAAKLGQPTMTDPKHTIPASIPIPAGAETGGAAGGASGTTDVSASFVKGTSAADSKPDARSSAAAAQTAANQQNQPLPTNRDAELKQLRAKQAKKIAKMEKKKKKEQEQKGGKTQQNQPQPTQGAQTPPGTPNPVTPNPNNPQASSTNPHQN